jgi:predicted alpha/beta superfamily hydrolase
MMTYPLSDGMGQLRRYPDFASRHVSARHVDVWCPPGSDSRPDLRYPVLYVQDGQNLFDPALAYGGVDWGMDEALGQLIQAGQISGAIVVGIWNSPDRWRDYMPAKPLTTPHGQELLTRFIREVGGEPLSDRYLQFLVEELKPFIDKHYPTRPAQPDTFIMGSSMGGLISLYALVECPQVFGGAGCLSTHWPAGGEALVEWLGHALPPAGRHKLYFDYGTATLDAEYEPYQQRMDEFVRAAGYRAGQDWLTRKFEGAEHSERAWRQRVHVPLAFLLG